uniref:Uncharacterized protein n=1 Tax=Arundo donax TaxID=35708 RepID=A0A0A9C0L7_ARUDO
MKRPMSLPRWVPVEQLFRLEFL